MLVTSIRCVPLTSLVSGLTKSSCGVALRQTSVRLVGRGGIGVRSGTVGTRKSIKERLLGPTTGTPFLVGTAFVAGSSALGIGALAYYGLGMSDQVGAIDRARIWPQFVRERVQSTYTYLAGGLILTAGSAYAVAQTPALLRIMTGNSLMMMFGSLAAIMGTGALCRGVEYQPGRPGLKQMTWALHCATIGAVLAPMCFLGGPLLMRAAWYTAGVVGGLSTIAACAPSDKFLNWGGPLAMGLGVVFVSNIGTFFLPPTTALGAGLYSIAIYGGLALFSAFLLYDTQRVIKMAENYPTYAVTPFDPVNAQLGIYLDTINIFIRIAMIMAGGGGRRK